MKTVTLSEEQPVRRPKARERKTNNIGRWTPEQEAVLVEMVKRGCSYEAIARRLAKNTQLNRNKANITKGAVAGKLFRLGLCTPARSTQGAVSAPADVAQEAL